MPAGHGCRDAHHYYFSQNWNEGWYRSQSRQQQQDSYSLPRSLCLSILIRATTYHHSPHSLTHLLLYYSYVTHGDVLKYLQDYKQYFGLNGFIQYNSKVTQLTVLDDDDDNEPSGAALCKDESLPKIRLEWTTTSTTNDSNEHQQHDDVFDAVCIANGHYAKPSCAPLDGLEEHFKGKVMHAIEYNVPDPFAGQTVLCIGGRASGSDLAREISTVANHVYLSDPGVTTTDTQGKVTCVPRTIGVADDGSILFQGGSLEETIDVIIFCTGYDYHFPFIHQDTSNLKGLSTDQRRVSPLYKELWHAQYPNLAFVGVQHSVVPFPYFELQMEAIVQQLLLQTNDISDDPSNTLPPLSERLEEAQKDATRGGSKCTGRIRDTHYLGDAQWDYCRDMAHMANLYNDGMETFIATNKVHMLCVLCVCFVLLHAQL